MFFVNPITAWDTGHEFFILCVCVLSFRKPEPKPSQKLIYGNEQYFLP